MSADPKQTPAGPAIMLDRNGPVLTLTLNRPYAMNAVTGDMCSTLRQLGDEIATDRSVRVVILQGAGKCFSVGGETLEADYDKL